MTEIKKEQNQKKYELAIPSKGRHDSCSFCKKLIESKINFYLFVEKEELEKYKESLGLEYVTYITHKESNRGIAYARNSIINYFKKNKIDYLYMADDDIQSLSLVSEEGKRIKIGIFKFLELFYTQSKKFEEANKNIAIYGLEYWQFSFSKKKVLYKQDNPVEVFCLVNLKNFNYEYDQNIAGKEDRDLCLQIITSGKNIFKFLNFCMLVPTIGSNKGGLHEFYETNKDAAAAMDLLNKWGPRLVTLIKKERKGSTKTDAKIDWKLAASIGAKIKNI